MFSMSGCSVRTSTAKLMIFVQYTILYFRLFQIYIYNCVRFTLLLLYPYAAKHISENKTIEKARWACFPDGKICLEDITDVYHRERRWLVLEVVDDGGDHADVLHIGLA